MEPSNLKLLLGLFFTDFVKMMIIPQTNMGLSGQDELMFGEFLHFLGLWLLMSTIIDPQRHEFWASYPIEAFHGAPLQLGCWMSWKWFDAILGALMYTNKDPPGYVDKFWEVHQMLKVWGNNKSSQFKPGWSNCLDESMSMWTDKFMCPGFMFVPQKPGPFGDKYYTVCCCTSGIMWGIELVEGKDHPAQIG